MKILFLIRSLGFGGAERQLIQLAQELAGRGLDVVIATFYPGGALESEVDPSLVSLVCLHKKSRWDVVGFAARLARLLRRERPDVVHGYGRTGNLAALAARAALPGARVAWGVRDSNMKLERYGWPAQAADWAASRLAGFADAVLVNSQRGLLHCVSQGYPAAKLIHVPNGIDTGRFRPTIVDGESLRHAWGVAPEERLIGLVGRLDPMKDHATFLHAAAALVPLRPDVRFVCVGGGSAEYRQRLEALSEELGIAHRIRWKGPQHDVTAVYNALDVVCSSSRYGEGFPNVVGEAMACGRPCVVTDAGDSAFVAGSAARVAPPGDPTALAAALLEALPEHGEGRLYNLAARRRIEECFSIPALAGRTLEALAGARRGRRKLRSARAAARS